VLVRVAAAGVNRPDCAQRAGTYPVPADASPLPGLEVAGEVVALGEGVPRWQTGAHVVALTHGGGYAGYVAVDARHCLPWPQGLTAVEAAALPEVAFTVEFNLMMRAGLAHGETVLIHGGASGIGSHAIQRARAAGARVLATGGSDAKLAHIRAMGADHAISYRGDWVAEVQAIVGRDGVDVVLDMVAGDYVARNLSLLARDGRYALIALLGGARAEVNMGTILRKAITLVGSTLRPQPPGVKARIAAEVEAQVWPHIAAGGIRPHVFATFPLARAGEAHALMESGAHMGKIVLEVA
jgi:NADPH2:quinone reductase